VCGEVDAFYQRVRREHERVDEELIEEERRSRLGLDSEGSEDIAANAERLHAEAVAPQVRSVKQATEERTERGFQLEGYRHEVGWRRWGFGSAGKTWRALKRALADAEHALARAEQDLGARREQLALPEAAAERRSRAEALAVQSRHFREQREQAEVRLRDLRLEVEHLEHLETELGTLLERLDDPCPRTLSQRQGLRRASRWFESREFEATAQEIANLRLPLTMRDRFALAAKAFDLLAEARAQLGGFFAAGKHGAVVQASLRLFRQAGIGDLPPLPADPQEQWLTLAEWLAVPARLRPDGLWVAFWTLFSAYQEFAEGLEAKAAEDVYTGDLAAALRVAAKQFGRPHLERFGYRPAPFDIMTARLAGKRPEREVGADLGLVIDINLDSYRCSKAALVQTKICAGRTVSLRADQKHQLLKLSEDLHLGFYGFYHQFTGTEMPLMTVRAARDIREDLERQHRVRLDAANPPSWAVSTVAGAWDFTAFVCFGLAAAASPVGVAFAGLEDALRKLGGGDNSLGLPRFLQVHALGTEENLERRRELLRDLGYELERERERSRDLGREGPGLDLSR
jgi:hypothetical protein